MLLLLHYNNIAVDSRKKLTSNITKTEAKTAPYPSVIYRSLYLRRGVTSLGDKGSIRKSLVPNYRRSALVRPEVRDN